MQNNPHHYLHTHSPLSFSSPFSKQAAQSHVNCANDVTTLK